MQMKRLVVFIILVCTLAAIAWLYLGGYFSVLPEKVYTADDFGIETVHSASDYNGNGIDDYTDILLGARKDAENKPRYDSAYYATGYPPDDIGVCTDVIWRAFKNAGFDLRGMLDRDIADNQEQYPYASPPDTNIDFRRVVNLKVFFEKYAQILTTDVNETDRWQPGDIVIFGDDEHIGIVSDKRNSSGETYIIHNGGQPAREEDLFSRLSMPVTGHYRFDATLIDSDILMRW